MIYLQAFLKVVIFWEFLALFIASAYYFWITRR